MLNKIILASKSKVRKEILDKHKILCEVKPSSVDEDIVKETLIKESADSLIRVSLTISSSTLDGFTSHNILCLSNISFLTLLLDARIILFNII